MLGTQTWMAATSAAMTRRGLSDLGRTLTLLRHPTILSSVMPALGAGIHVFAAGQRGADVDTTQGISLA